MKIRVPAPIWAAWLIVTLPLTIFNLLAYVSGLVVVK